jgi:endonuclease YncB( thermonuclease family)
MIAILGIRRTLRGIALLIGLCALWWSYEASQQYFGSQESIVGRVTRVRDGDTIEVSDRAIRLKGLTCDERGTVFGETATEEVRRVIAEQTVSCVLTGERTYDRAVGWCSLSDGRDIGEILIAQGMCGRCDRYDPFRKYAAVQAQAGMFSGNYPSYCRALW